LVSKTHPLIAVVDDEPPVRTMLRRALQLADYEVATFAGGEEFLAALLTVRPACVILDIRMPVLSGFDIEKRMRAMNLRIPLILITASDDATIDRSAAAAGAMCLLRKPFSTDALLAAVRQALGAELLGT
jgi:FixJ family two-component response regulator